MSKLYRIGLDIGIGSVGYAVIENDPISEEPCRIIDLGVRTFNPNEVSKTGESTAKKRRKSRGVHRRKRRKEFRFLRMKNLFSRTFGQEVFDEINTLNFGNKEKGLLPADVYELRFKALDEKISDAELFKIVLHLLKYRGFKSNRKNLEGGAEEGKLKQAINSNVAYMEEKGYRTIGEMIYKDERFFKVNSSKDKHYRVYNVRNHGGDYANCFYRKDLAHELELILNSQYKFGNERLSDEFIKKVLEIFNAQRNFDEGPGEGSPYSAKFEEGNCTFEMGEKRAPKASYTFEWFNAISKINNLRVNGNDLSFEQKQELYELIKEKEQISFAEVRKKFGFTGLYIFNLCSYKLSKKDENLAEDEYIKKCESKVFVSMRNSYKVKKMLGLDSSYNNRDLIDEICNLLTHCKSDNTIDEYIAGSEILRKLSDEQKEAIKTLNFDKFGSLSYKAMKKIEPFLLKGDRYDIACKNVGFNHSSFECEKLEYLKGGQVEDMLAELTNNVVRRAVNQTLRIVNQIIKKYGSPQFVSVELARELSKNKKERGLVEKNQKDREASNDKIVERLENEFKITKPTGQDILKLKLYEEQNGKCMYSGKPIDEARMFEPNYLQIDHILPISKSMNDSFNNKVLVIADENQNKGNRTPFEYFGDDEEKWNAFESRVRLLKNREKQRNLLKKVITEQDQKEFISRNINDTRYMSKFLLELFNKYLKMNPVKQKDNKVRKVIYSVNGATTNYLRKSWGINKIRDDGNIHHAVDACVIATVNDSIIQRITAFNKFKEIFIQDGDKFISKVTGEVMNEEEKIELENSNLKKLGARLPMPYEWFLRELQIRSSVKYSTFEFDENEKLDLAKMGYDESELNQVKPVFISCMKTVKNTGAIHEETLMSTREYKETKRLIKTVSITKLNVSQKQEQEKLKDDKYPEFSIENYYRPQDDRLLYLKLKNWIVENGKIPESLEFHKPKKDGTDGPIVRTVKMYEKATSCVITPNGGAANASMHRIDVFENEGKFYICPVYMSDVYKHKLPNKVIEIGKDWTAVDESFNFKFSLYQNDLVKVKHKNEIVLTKNFKNPKSKKSEKIINNEFMLYYNNTDISNASIKLTTHDNCYSVRLGVKTLLSLEKYYVDIMGKIYKSPQEKRKQI